jgi:uncharacterized delta-60 repeat protein
LVQSLEERTAPAAGMLDPTFAVGGRVTTRFPIGSDDYGRSTAIDSLGRIVVAGDFDNGSDFDIAVARFTPAGALDATFGGTGIVTIAFGGNFDHAFAVAIDSLDRVVVAGGTNNGITGPVAVARLTAAGTLDTTFDGDGKQTIGFGGTDEFARGVAIDSLDRIVVAGSTYNGTNHDIAVARLTVAGTLDTTFDGDGKQAIALGTGEDYAYAVTIDSLDSVVVGGSAVIGGTDQFAVVRFAVGGALDNTFDGDGWQTLGFGGSNERARGVGIDSLDRIVVAGISYSGSSFQSAVARLTPAGALDSSFDGDGRQTVDFGATQFDDGHILAIDSLDRVVVASSNRTASNRDFAVARLTVTGALDSSFDGDGKQIIVFAGIANSTGVAVDSTDRIVLAGIVQNVSSYDFAVARLTIAGALDSGFDGDGKQTINVATASRALGYSVAVDSQGRTVVAGIAWNGANYDMVVTRYTSSGALDTTFGGAGIVMFTFGGSYQNVGSVAIDSLDRIVVAGVTRDGSNDDFAVARLTPAGALDSSFDGDGKQTIGFLTNDRAYAVAIDSLNRIVLAGQAIGASSVVFAVARLTAAGALDSSFDGDGKQTISFGFGSSLGEAVAIDSLGRILVAGDWYNASNGNDDFAVARLTTAGALDSSFSGDGKQTVVFGTSNEIAYGVAVDSFDRVVLAGYVANTSNYDFAVARLTTAGTLDSSFDGDGKQTIDFGASSDTGYGVAVDSLDRVVVAGRSGAGFTVARLTAAGVLDSSFDSDGKQTINFGGSTDVAYGVAVDAADRVVLAGTSNYNGQVFALARLTGDTTTASAQVNDGSAQRSRVTSLTVRFSGQVTFSGPVTNAFTLTRVGAGAVTFAANLSVEFGGTVVVLANFTGPETEFGSLRDGRYTLTALASQISAGGQALDGDANGTPGGDFVFGEAQGLFRFFGDINGDRHVDIADFGLFTGTFNLSTGQTGFLAAFDFNGDGHVDIADFGQFSVRFFTPLP